MFILKIDISNDAFEECSSNEIARILKKLAQNVYNGKEPTTLLDINGNVCGSVEW